MSLAVECRVASLLPSFTVRSYESRRHTVCARDGWPLDVLEVAPQCTPKAAVLLGHAMMVDRRTMMRADRPSIGGALVDAGFLVLAPDLRGHGHSGPGADRGANWTYDDLVGDTGDLVAWATSHAAGLPLVLAGHSLFGHVSMAWLGQHPHAKVAALVALGADVWRRKHESHALKWWFKANLLRFSILVAERVGYMPARRLRIGSVDEALGYWRSFQRLLDDDRWCSADGVDYQAACDALVVPLLHVVSRRDWLYAEPTSALCMTRAVRDRTVVWLGKEREPGPFVPDHMGLVTDPRACHMWQTVVAWIDARVDGERSKLRQPQ